MQASFAQLFKPFVAVEYPIRYFLLLFLVITGAFQLTNVLSVAILDREFDLSRAISYPLLLSVLIFISQYFKQKKSKQMSAQTITASS